MSNNDSFSQALFTAVEEKIQWYDSTEMPKLLEEYHIFHSHIANLFGLLIKKGVLTPDPYKKDNKISDITIPDDSAFLDNERSVVIGKRLSDFESMLDFLCNYYKFSISVFTPEVVKRLVALSNCFLWSTMSTTNPKPNTRGLAIAIASAKQSDALSANVLSDSVQHAAQCVSKINTILKDINDFLKEIYKVEVRKSVFEHPTFSSDKAATSEQEAMNQIRKLFPAVMGKVPFYPELIEEIIEETYGPNRVALQKNLLEKFTIQKATEKTAIEEDNSRETLLDAVISLSSISPQLDQIISKIDDNKHLLDSEHNTFWDKIKAVFRQAFGLKEESVEYHLTITDQATQTKRSERLNYNDFYNALAKRSRFYTTFSLRKAPGYQKISAQPDEKILEFLLKQLAECQNLIQTLNGLDIFFKNAPSVENRSKIRGLQIELTAIKNALVKTNQKRAEYASLIEEQAQMKKLGIINGN